MAAAARLRSDYDGAALRKLSRTSCDAKQVRQLLALAAIYEGLSRSEAARGGGVTLQIVTTGSCGSMPRGLNMAGLGKSGHPLVPPTQERGSAGGKNRSFDLIRDLPIQLLPSGDPDDHRCTCVRQTFSSDLDHGCAGIAGRPQDRNGAAVPCLCNRLVEAG